MEVNRDEAIRCLDIARNRLASGNITGAIKFAQKSINLFPTPEAQTFLKRVESRKTTQSPNESNNDRSASPPPPPSPSSSSREHKQGRQTREYTTEQAEAVKRIRACGVHDFYSILGISKEVSDSEVKKAYRKLALQMHPDKNGAPGADEAFKLVSKAFQVLSDPQKRAAFDENGVDPDSRNSGMPPGFGGARFNNGFTNGAVFADEISPEELFNMFFNADGSKYFSLNYLGFHSATFVGPGFRARRFQPRRASPNGDGPQEQQSSAILTCLQLLPLILLFFFSLSSNWLTQTPEPMPAYSLHQTDYHTQSRYTHSLNVPYYVDPKSFSSLEQNPRKLHKFEDNVEVTFVKSLTSQCNSEAIFKQRRINEARGWVFQDEEKLKEAQHMKLPNCEKLMDLSKTKRYNEVRRMMRS
ncbi:5787_t:CDS:2 [Funneliformis geosporum]|nr:5787_t:CDS:2 [Funneliformis geosporum]